MRLSRRLIQHHVIITKILFITHELIVHVGKLLELFSRGKNGFDDILSQKLLTQFVHIMHVE